MSEKICDDKGEEEGQKGKSNDALECECSKTHVVCDQPFSSKHFSRFDSFTSVQNLLNSREIYGKRAREIERESKLAM